jgi:hypothetical protein
VFCVEPSLAAGVLPVGLPLVPHGSRFHAGGLAPTAVALEATDIAAATPDHGALGVTIPHDALLYPVECSVENRA